ncbi:hypothetical protein LINPERHAP1_LOCUS16456, partial [Linum perenne]
KTLASSIFSVEGFSTAIVGVKPSGGVDLNDDCQDPLSTTVKTEPKVGMEGGAPVGEKEVDATISGGADGVNPIPACFLFAADEEPNTFLSIDPAFSCPQALVLFHQCQMHGAAYAARSIRAWQTLKTRPRAFYKGGFQPSMTKRETALIPVLHQLWSRNGMIRFRFDSAL